MMTNEDVEAVAVRVVALLRAEPVVVAPLHAETADVLTLAEARSYVKRPSRSAFHVWCKKWGVRAAAHGRYARARLDVALGREARRAA
jgi:hypothetical protein